MKTRIFEVCIALCLCFTMLIIPLSANEPAAAASCTEQTVLRAQNDGPCKNNTYFCERSADFQQFFETCDRTQYHTAVNSLFAILSDFSSLQQECGSYQIPDLPSQDNIVPPQDAESEDFSGTDTAPDIFEHNFLNAEEARVLELINAERAAYGYKPLQADAVLGKAADIRGQEIQTSFSHTRPDGRSCFTALQEVNASYSKAGENIAIGQTSPESVVDAWMASPGHRANILNPDYTRVGLTAVPSTNSQYGGYAWVQMFAD